MPWLFFLRWQSREKGKPQHAFGSFPNKEAGTQQVCIRRGCLNSLSRQFTLLWHQLHQYFKILSRQLFIKPQFPCRTATSSPIQMGKHLG